MAALQVIIATQQITISRISIVACHRLIMTFVAEPVNSKTNKRHHLT